MTTEPTDKNANILTATDQPGTSFVDSDDTQLERLRGLFNIQELENIAKTGFDTYKGKRLLEFRASVEIEFKVEKKDTEPNAAESARLLELRENARTLIEGLDPVDVAQKELKERWLSQIDDFGAAELLNFVLYNEFSTPQLGIPSLHEDASLQELDDFSEKNGWLEWRFGTDIYQAGYYDNAGMAEVRLSPTSPTETARRAEVIKNRLHELASELGVSVSTSAESEHINFSAYEASDPHGLSIFGHGLEQSSDTIDATSGVFKAHQDGIALSPVTMRRYDYMFSKYSRDTMVAAPTRRSLRVLNGRLELRAKFYTTEHGIAWLAAGTIEGLALGAQQMEELGYPATSYTEVHEVDRTANFDKNNDLQIQRAFENSTRNEDGGFELNFGYEAVRGDSIEQDLLGGKDGHPGVVPKMVLAAARLDDEGIPFITKGTLTDAYETFLSTFKHTDIRESIGELDSVTLDKTITEINERLKKIRIKVSRAVTGESEQVVDSKEAAVVRLRGSKAVSLAFGTNIDALIREIDDATQYFKESTAEK